jgi:hypothetical protein
MRHLIPESGMLQSASLGPLLLPPQGGEEVDKAKVEAELLERRNLSRSAAGRLSLTPYQYAHLTNDGLALLRQHAAPDSRVFCMDLVNPFSVALGLPPPKGGMLWWDRMTFNRQIFPAPEQVFADVTQVMIPKSGLNTQALQAIYLPYVTAHFRHAGESVLWDLYSFHPNNGENREQRVRLRPETPVAQQKSRGLLHGF